MPAAGQGGGGRLGGGGGAGQGGVRIIDHLFGILAKLNMVEESSPIQNFCETMFSVHLLVHLNLYFNENIVLVYLLVHQNKFLTLFSVFFLVHQFFFFFSNL